MSFDKHSPRKTTGSSPVTPMRMFESGRRLSGTGSITHRTRSSPESVHSFMSSSGYPFPATSVPLYPTTSKHHHAHVNNIEGTVEFQGSRELYGLAKASTTPNLFVIAGHKTLQLARISDNDIVLESELNCTFSGNGGGNGLRSGSISEITDVQFGYQAFGRYIAASSPSGAVYMFNLDRGKRIRSIYGEHARSVNSVDFSPMAPYTLVTGSQDGLVKVWDLRTRNHRSVVTMYSDAVRAARCNRHDGNVICSVHDTGSIRKWDIRSPDRAERRVAASTAPIYALDWHPELNYVLIGGRDRQLQVWNMGSLSGQKVLLPEYKLMLPSPILRLKWRRGRGNGSVMNTDIAATFLSGDSSIQIWNLGRTYVPRMALPTNKDSVTGMVWKDPTHLVATLRSGRLVQYDVMKQPEMIDNLAPIKAAFNPSTTKDFSFTLQKKDDYFARDEPVRITRLFSKGMSAKELGEVNMDNRKQKQQPKATPGLVSGTFSERDTFLGLCRGYQIRVPEGKDLLDACEHNSKAALAVGDHTDHVVWKLLRLNIIRERKEKEKLGGDLGTRRKTRKKKQKKRASDDLGSVAEVGKLSAALKGPSNVTKETLVSSSIETDRSILDKAAVSSSVETNNYWGTPGSKPPISSSPVKEGSQWSASETTKNERNDKNEKLGKNENNEKSEKSEKAEKDGKGKKDEKSEKGEKSEKDEKDKKVKKSESENEKSGKSESDKEKSRNNVKTEKSEKKGAGEKGEPSAVAKASGTVRDAEKEEQTEPSEEGPFSSIFRTPSGLFEKGPYGDIQLSTSEFSFFGGAVDFDDEFSYKNVSRESMLNQSILRQALNKNESAEPLMVEMDEKNLEAGPAHFGKYTSGLIRRAAEYSAGRGDVATCSAMALLFSPLYPESFTPLEVKEWVNTCYCALKHRSQFALAAELLNQAPFLKEMLQYKFTKTEMWMRCQTCHEPITNPQTRMLLKSRNDIQFGYWYCEKCKSRPSKCCYCMQPDKGSGILLKCGHWGHFNCFEEWFEQETCCPSCGLDICEH